VNEWLADRGRRLLPPAGRSSVAWWAGLLAGLAIIGVVLSLLPRLLPEGHDPTWERIVATGNLTVCTDPSWPPFEFVDEQTGRLEGLDIDLARRLGRRLGAGIETTLVTVGFDSLYDALLSGRCDAVLSALPYEAMRTQDVAYSVAYFNAGLVLVRRQGTQGIEQLEDLEGRLVGVEWGFVPEGDRRQQDFMQKLSLRRYDLPADALQGLEAGEVDAVLADRISVLTYLMGSNGLQIVGEPLVDLNYVIPVRPDSFRLLEEIDRVLLEMREDGTLEELQARWFQG
jgi:polar amino acid transport system substrate-binding protein